MAEDRQDPIPVVGTTPEDEPADARRNDEAPADDRTDEIARGAVYLGDAPAGVAASSWVPLVIGLTVMVVIVLGIATSWLL